MNRFFAAGELACNTSLTHSHIGNHTMKKIALLAATALALTPVFAAAQTTDVRITRADLIAAGIPGSHLTRYENVAVSAQGSSSLTCNIAWEATGVDPLFSGLNTQTVNGTVAYAGAMQVEASRYNPNGQAIGQAVYNGTFLHATAAATAPVLTCPAGGTRTEPGIPGRDAVAYQRAVFGESYRDPICVAQAKDRSDAADQAAFDALMAAYQNELLIYSAKQAEYAAYLTALAAWEEDDNARQRAANTGNPDNRVPYVQQPKLFNFVADPGPAPQEPRSQSNGNSDAGVNNCDLLPGALLSAEVPAQDAVVEVPAITYTYSYVPSGAQTFSLGVLTVVVENQTYTF